ncbi:MAG: 16S rRNA (uracil(1498)-N(3))-methyltransferase [Ruminococcus sp.]|nr:16S rRNA (uracil(1498)-N(3))-methyltransferase [Ruminococcus sp.]
MAWFFINENITSDQYVLCGENAKHISKVLRMNRGEELTLVTPEKIQCKCEVFSISSDSVIVEVLEKKPCENEPDVEVTLYQALPKGDKMEYIIQKCVELGITKIVPMITARCVSRPDMKSLAKKQVRWQKIAMQAAMQSRRGIIPKICDGVSFQNAAELTKKNDKTILFYEMGGEPVHKILTQKPKTLGIFIGSEGGFEQSEADLIIRNGGSTATLGNRILRCETAPLAALSVIMYQTGNFD